MPEQDSAQHRTLLRATKCEPGFLPQASMWEDLLSQDKSGKLEPRSGADNLRRSVSVTDGLGGGNGGAAASRGNGTPSATNSAAPSPTLAQSEYASNRPKRSGKKRSYHDNTFTGYGEGYVDDDVDNDSAYDDDGKKKKRRKV